jgi:hypothetical protein
MLIANREGPELEARHWGALLYQETVVAEPGLLERGGQVAVPVSVIGTLSAALFLR